MVLKVLWNKKSPNKRITAESHRVLKQSCAFLSEYYSPFEKKALACLEDFIESGYLTVCLVPQGANSEMEIGTQ